MRFSIQKRNILRCGAHDFRALANQKTDEPAVFASQPTRRLLRPKLTVLKETT
jgi:hypothetical protein